MRVPAADVAHVGEQVEQDSQEGCRCGEGADAEPETTISHRPTSSVKDLDAVHRDNLRLLRRAGVRLAIGTDDNSRTVFEEIANIRRLQVFDDLTLLKIWTEDIPRTMFPKRRIEFLKDGYEASFVALDGDPLENFSYVKKLSFRMKQGHLIRADGSH